MRDSRLELFHWLHGLFRLWPVWIANIILLVIIYKLAPHQMGLLVYKTAFITWSALIGYWIYRWVEVGAETNVDRERQRDRRMCFIVGAIVAFALAA